MDTCRASNVRRVGFHRLDDFIFGKICKSTSIVGIPYELAQHRCVSLIRVLMSKDLLDVCFVCRMMNTCTLMLFFIPAVMPSKQDRCKAEAATCHAAYERIWCLHKKAVVINRYCPDGFSYYSSAHVSGQCFVQLSIALNNT